jgi:hypothetical protein
MITPSQCRTRKLPVGRFDRIVVVMCLGMMATGAAPAVFAAEGSLPTEVPRPGPDILYAPPARAPQFENSGVWTAEPIRISGASAYRNGEFLYQDFLYDDQGANGGYTYPTDPIYAANAADFVEVRLKPLAEATAVRITYNSMLDPEVVATTIAFGGTSTQLYPMPHGANTQAPGQVFVTIHGATGTIIDAATGSLLGVPEVSVSLERRQVEVRIPHSIFDPRGQTAVRVAAATGLWDMANDRYNIPLGTASATRPGGAGSRANPTAFFNVAFRYTESGTWNNSQQNSVLNPSNPSIGALFASVDFTKLAAGVTDDMLGQVGGVPQTGYMARILASHFEPQQGRGPNTSSINGRPQPTGLVPDFPGNLQPYTLYVPNKPVPERGYGLVLRPHPCGGNYKSLVSGTTNAIGEQGEGWLVVFPQGRGNCLWYWSESGADVFEAYADVARYYKLDPTRTASSGFSMGGYGTYKFIGQWPDLFATGVPNAGCVGAEAFWPGPPAPNASGPATLVNLMLPSYRNVPILSGNGSADVICIHTAQLTVLADLEQLGYRFEWREYPSSHANVINDQGVADHLGATSPIDRNPPHVTYVYNLKASETTFGLNADHAYWLSGLKLRDESGSAPVGKIDVRSHGFGVGDPPALQTQPIATTGYTGFRKDWGDAPAEPIENRLDIVAQNISAVTIHPERARVDCDVVLNIQSDGPITVTLAGCEPSVQEGNKTTGGGWLAAADGAKLNFGFSAEQTADGLEGELQLNDHGARVKISLTQVTSLGAVGAGCGSIGDGPNALEFQGAGTYNGASASFRVCVQDSGEGEGAATDRFYLACTAGCTYGTGMRVSDDGIDGGNIQVRRVGDAGAGDTPQPATIILDPLLLTEGVAGQAQTFTVRVFDQHQQPLVDASVTLTGTTASGGELLSVSGRTNFLGAATIMTLIPGEAAEYRATAGGAESNAIEVAPLLP